MPPETRGGQPERHSTDVGLADDSRDFAAVERAYLRKFGVPFEWLRYDTPSARRRLAMLLRRAASG